MATTNSKSLVPVNVNSALNQSCGSVVVEHTVSTYFHLYTQFIKEDMMSTFQILQITVTVKCVK